MNWPTPFLNNGPTEQAAFATRWAFLLRIGHEFSKGAVETAFLGQPSIELERPHIRSVFRGFLAEEHMDIVLRGWLLGICLGWWASLAAGPATAADSPLPPGSPTAGAAKRDVATPSAPAAKSAPPQVPTRDIDLCEAMGISQERLLELVEAELKTGEPWVPLALILRTPDGKCLVNTRIKISWQGGTQIHVVNWTGQLVFGLNRERIKGLKLTVPAPYTRLLQTTFAEGPSYCPPADFSYFNVDVTDDSSKIRKDIQRQLIDIRQRGDQTAIATLQRQLGRTGCTLELAEPSGKPMTPAQIYQLRKPSVVVMARLNRGLQMSIASGVIIGSEGVVVTNYHVMLDDTGSSEVHAARLADGRMYPVREVLAADRSTDVAIVQIAATNLVPAPLSPGEPVGAPVAIIAHPDQRFYFLTTGSICRYARAMFAGDERVFLEVSAEFMPGSSGGPVFSAEGSVAGIVSTITTSNRGMCFDNASRCSPFAV